MIMSSSKNLKCIWNCKCELGESVIWVREHNSIYFTDIKKKIVLRYNIKTKKKKKYKFDKQIGFIAFIKKDLFILGMERELRIINIKNKKVIRSMLIEDKKPGNRINDGKTDPKGNIWFGTMDDIERNIFNGSLYVLSKNFELSKVDKNYIITNGPAFLNYKVFYHNDSRKRIIYKIYINKDLKKIKKKVFLKFSKKDGNPDGMTVDNKGNLFVAFFGGGNVSEFNRKGILINKIILPVKNVTSCTFGGDKNNELYITSARLFLTKNELRKSKLSGSLFKIRLNNRGKKTKNYCYTKI